MVIMILKSVDFACKLYCIFNSLKRSLRYLVLLSLCFTLFSMRDEQKQDKGVAMIHTVEVHIHISSAQQCLLPDLLCFQTSASILKAKGCMKEK